MSFSLPPPESQSSRSHYSHQSLTLETVIRPLHIIRAGGRGIHQAQYNTHTHTRIIQPVLLWLLCIYINEQQYSIIDIRCQIYRAVELWEVQS